MTSIYLIRYRQTPKGRYARHKANAKYRGIAFELTFEQWARIWKDSGHWEERGRRKAGVYVMCRFGDVGPYAVGNVYIATHSRNVAERNVTVRRKHTARSTTVTFENKE